MANELLNDVEVRRRRGSARAALNTPGRRLGMGTAGRLLTGGESRPCVGRGPLMDAITLLTDDHKTVEQLFKRFEKAGDRALVEKREIVDRIIEELSVHAAIEEQVFYPVARATVPGTEDIALESLEEHHIVKWVLSELDGHGPDATSASTPRSPC